MIWRPRSLTRSPREARRLEAGRLLQAGQLSQAEMARRLGVSRRAVSQWARQLRQHHGDLGRLPTPPIPGRPARLRVAPWQRVLAVLTEGALTAGFETDRWTLVRIRAVMLVAFGGRSHAHDLARRLKALGWSAQPPAVSARERDEALVRAWLTHDGPRMNKRLAAEARQSSSSMNPGSRFAPRRPPPGPRGGRRPFCGVSANAVSSPRSLG
jgi:transposase